MWEKKNNQLQAPLTLFHLRGEKKKKKHLWRSHVHGNKLTVTVRLNRIMEHFASPHLTSTSVGLLCNNRDYNRKNYKFRVFKKEYLGKPKDEDIKGNFSLWHLQQEQTGNNSPTPSQINIKSQFTKKKNLFSFCPVYHAWLSTKKINKAC